MSLESLSITASKTPKDLELLQLGGDSREEVSPGKTWDNFPRGILDCFLTGDLIFSTHWIITVFLFKRAWNLWNWVQVLWFQRLFYIYIYISLSLSLLVTPSAYTGMSSGREEQRLVTYGHVARHWLAIWSSRVSLKQNVRLSSDHLIISTFLYLAIRFDTTSWTLADHGILFFRPPRYENVVVAPRSGSLRVFFVCKNGARILRLWWDRSIPCWQQICYNL